MEQEIKMKSDELATQLTRSAVVAATETQIVRRRFEETFGNSDLNHMANWISEILKAFYIFESVDKAVGETMAALDEIKKYMTPKESEVFSESVTMSRGWILLYYAVPKRANTRNNKCVYVLQMDNDTVKIGVSADFRKRKAVVKNGSGAEVLKCCRTDYIDNADAYKIEAACHKAFKLRRLKGEFFKITYEDACAELEKHAPIVERKLKNE